MDRTESDWTEGSPIIGEPVMAGRDVTDVLAEARYLATLLLALACTAVLLFFGCLWAAA